MINKKSSVIFLVFVFIVFGLAVGVSYYRYVTQQNFVYFSSENDVPDRFDANTYLNI